MMYLGHRPGSATDLVSVAVHQNIHFAAYVTFLVVALVAGMIYAARLCVPKTTSEQVKLRVDTHG
jgi:hypothetical protein